MRILHTSDWHIGRSLHGVDLCEATDAFLDWLEQQVREHAVDAVLIAGDVFDRAIPPVSAVRRLSEALTRLCDVATVVLIPGNHDSAWRLGFGADLMRPRLRIISRVSAIGHPVLLEGRDGQRCLVYPIPYLEPDVVRQELSERLAVLDDSPPFASRDSSLTALPTPERSEGDFDISTATPSKMPVTVGRSHQAVMDAALTLIRADRQRRVHEGEDLPSLVMVHAFITGAAPSDSERDIRVGGVENVGASTFDGFDYIAAGHLHRPQTIEGSTSPIYYSGSPIAYSFSEAGTPKTVVLLDIGADGVNSIKHLPTPCLRPLSVIRDSMEAILSDIYARERSHYVAVTVTDDARPAQMTTRIRECFPYALVIMHEGAFTPRASIAPQAGEVRSPRDVMMEFFEEISGSELSHVEHDLIDEVWTGLRINTRDNTTAGEKSRTPPSSSPSFLQGTQA